MSTVIGRRSVGFCVALSVVVSIVAAPAALGNGNAGPVIDRAENVSPIARLDLARLGDIAFWGDVAAVSIGTGDKDPYNDGFALVDISQPDRPREISRFFCTSSHYDVAIWQDLVFLAVEEPVIDESCDAKTAEAKSATTFSGVRVISIKNRAQPRQITAVTTNDGQGAHTLSILPDLKREGGPRLLVYSNGFTPETIIEVPLDDPSAAHAVAHLRDPVFGAGCHDVSFFAPRKLALCATGPTAESQLWDVSNPAQPSVKARIANPLIQNHHGAAFSWDGNTVILADEDIDNFETSTCWGGKPSTQGALWFYDITNAEAPVLRNWFQIPQESPLVCTAHQFNVVPLASGRGVLVAGWYTAGTTIVDFTNLSDIHQIGFHQGDPTSDADRSHVWSSYWYDGRIYVTNGGSVSASELAATSTQRGLDVLTVNDPLFDNAIKLGRYNFGLQEAIPGLTPAWLP